jgi:hypothetical protein
VVSLQSSTQSRHRAQRGAGDPREVRSRGWPLRAECTAAAGLEERGIPAAARLCAVENVRGLRPRHAHEGCGRPWV